MSEFGMASMGLDSATSAINMVGQAQVRKQNRAMRRLGDKQRQSQHDYTQGEMGFQQQDVNRSADESSKAELGNASARGVLHSSIPIGEQEKIEAERKRRYATIQRRKDLDQSSFQNESEMISHQRKSEDITNSINMITGILGGGAGGAAQSYSGRTY